jgi:hypothetical protein
MYFPYFRGRQYELLALRELAQGGLLGSHVIPVVEPVKINSTYNAAVKLFVDMKQPLAIILNPAVGDLSGGSASSAILPSIIGSVIPSVIMNKNAPDAVKVLALNDVLVDNMLAIMTNRDFLDTYRDLFEVLSPQFTLFPDERQIKRAVVKNKVMFADNFKKQEKNADYLKQEDEFYSEDHLFYKDEGFVGFGDYSIIGDEYVENGFAPYAVAIHIIYFAEDDTLRIRHFVSDSNTDIKDVAGKFYEAVTKLRRWYEAGQSRQLTTALSILLDHADKGYYPGLPTIKKLSIMHHLELVSKYLDSCDRGVRK